MKRLAACLCALGFLVSFVPAISSGSAGGPYDSVTGAGVRGSLRCVDMMMLLSSVGAWCAARATLTFGCGLIA